MTPRVALLTAVVLPLLARGQTVHHLAASARTVVVGVYDASRAPALRIASGDIVEVETLGVNTQQLLTRLGVSESRMQPALLEVTRANPDKRGHFLTGPIYVEGAAPGDVLEVQIRRIRLAQPFAVNSLGQNGVLADQFPLGLSRLIPLDAERGVAHFAEGVDIPLHPFFGSMGVAPAAGSVSSTPPGVHAGNLDNLELVEGTTLFIPVQTAGALFQVGDGHARQGDGEVDQTGLETSLTGEFRFVVRKDLKFKWPRAETPTHWIAMGMDPDLNLAVRQAVLETVEFLTAEKGLSRADAYMFTSAAVSLRITQLVDQTKGVHAMIPKAAFTRK